MCPMCRGLFMAWITTCPQCAVPLTSETAQCDLAHQVAPIVEPAHSWVDIAVSCDEPVKVALLTQLLNEQEIPYEASRRFISIEKHNAPKLERIIDVWAFTHDMPEDPRNTDSLASTMAEIGYAVYEALHGTVPATLLRKVKASADAGPSDLTLD